MNVPFVTRRAGPLHVLLGSNFGFTIVDPATFSLEDSDFFVQAHLAFLSWAGPSDSLFFPSLPDVLVIGVDLFSLSPTNIVRTHFLPDYSPALNGLVST